MQHTGLVGRNLDVLDQSRVAPDGEAVVGEAGRGDDLLVRSAPAEGSNLASGVDAVDASARGGVPEVDVSVVGSTAGGEQVGLPRAPGECLDGGLVVGLLELGGRELTGIPDGDEVVVATSRELRAIGTPFEAADLGGVGNELGDLVLRNADVVVVHQTRAGTGGEDVLVPAHDADASIVTVHGSELGTLLDVPDLDLTRAKTGSDVSTVTAPLDRRDVGVLGALEQAGNSARLGRPDVDAALKANGDLVARGPIEQVEVVIIDQARSIENTLGSSQDAATELRRRGGSRLERTVVLRSKIDRARRFGGRRLEGEDALLHANTTRLGNRLLVRNRVRAPLGLAVLVIIEVEALEVER